MSLLRDRRRWVEEHHASSVSNRTPATLRSAATLCLDYRDPLVPDRQTVPTSRYTVRRREAEQIASGCELGHGMDASPRRLACSADRRVSRFACQDSNAAIALKLKAWIAGDRHAATSLQLLARGAVDADAAVALQLLACWAGDRHAAIPLELLAGWARDVDAVVALQLTSGRALDWLAGVASLLGAGGALGEGALGSADVDLTCWADHAAALDGVWQQSQARIALAQSVNVQVADTAQL